MHDPHFHKLAELADQRLPEGVHLDYLVELLLSLWVLILTEPKGVEVDFFSFL